MTITSKGLLTKNNEDDAFELFCWLIWKLFHISKDIMSIKKYGHLFFKKSFAKK